MPRFKVAHIREQGVDLIIVPLDWQFGQKTEQEQFDIRDELQLHANGAGLAGTVVPVWQIGSAVHFIAPQQWHPFFKSMTWPWLLENINREIYW